MHSFRNKAPNTHLRHLEAGVELSHPILSNVLQMSVFVNLNISFVILICDGNETKKKKKLLLKIRHITSVIVINITMRNYNISVSVLWY